MTLDQVRTAQPTLDYDGIYANHGGAPGNTAEARTWTGDRFLAAVYQDPSRQPPRGR
jgi:hypothetical protein